MDLATGQPESHPSVLSIDAATTPGVAPPTPVAGGLSGPTSPARDTVAEFQDQQAAGEADCRRAQAARMAAETDRRHHYAGVYGDTMTLPTVPEDASGPAADFLFAEGDQPGKGT